jgi:dTDP-4-amino-4,6-dideoxygalactose transaminase
VIPILELTTQYESLRSEINEAVEAVFRSGHFINGMNVSALEREISAYVGAGFAVGVNSGTDALHLALRALDIGPGDEVITTPFTFVATTEAIGIVGATPVFVDIDPSTYNMVPAQIERAITKRTRAILPVHLYGAPVPMTEIMSLARAHGLAVVEDCAQAIGAMYDGRAVGTFGDAGCFSFFPSKNLGACGDGGMLTTNSPALAERFKSLRAHGGRVKYHHEELGVNSRLDELQAAILRVKLPHLDGWIARRREIAERYSAAFREVPEIEVPVEVAGSRSVYHQYTIRVPQRDAVRALLREAGVETMVYYPIPLHLQKVHESLRAAAGDFPESERAAEEVLSLPMFPELTLAQQDAVIRAVINVVQSATRGNAAVAAARS